MNQIFGELLATLIIITPIWTIATTIILITKSKRTEEKIDYILQWIDKNDAKEELAEIEHQLEELKK